MSIMDFTVEETCLVAIYRRDTAAATLERIAAALPDMDGEMQSIAEGASRKLAALTAPEFAAYSFAPEDETDGAGDYE